MSSRWRALAVLIAVLVLGLLLGMMGTRLWQREAQEDRGELGAARLETSTERLAERLHLSAEQQAQLDSILADLRAQIRTTREKMGKEFDEIRARTNDRIAAILTDEQKQQFEQMLKKAESHRRSGGHRPYAGDRRPER